MNKEFLVPIAIVVTGLLISVGVYYSFVPIYQRFASLEAKINSLQNKIDSMEERQINMSDKVNIMEAVVKLIKSSISGLTDPYAPSRAGLEFDYSGRPVRGNENAKLTIVEFSDFMCPFCKRVHPTVLQVLDLYEEEVNLVLIHAPFHSSKGVKYSELAAMGFECATLQGKRWEYGDKIFEDAASWWDEEKEDYISKEEAVQKLKNYAVELELDEEQFSQCLDLEQTKEVVESDLALTNSLGINATPSFVINGNLYEGAYKFDTFMQIIENELAAVESS